MRIDKRNSNDERRVLIGMIVDPVVLGRISSRWQPRLFRSKWANIIAKWCNAYYTNYEQAPMMQIESLFETWSEETKDKDSVGLVGKFLDGLSDEYETLKDESNSDYVIDLAGRHFNRVRMECLIESVQSELDGGDSEKAHERLVSYNQIELGLGEGIDILHDVEAIKEAFADRQEPLIMYPGDLGKFFGSSLERDGFIGFLGKKGIGKSWWLMDVAYRAMLQRHRVAFFEVGDMSRNQIMRRLMVRVSQHPQRRGDVKYPKRIFRIKGDDDKDETQVSYKNKQFNERLSWKVARKACKKLMRKRIKSKESYFKLSSHPSSVLKVSGIESILQDWARESWEPDVIVIDYADILNMEYSGIEGRDRINQTWSLLRSLSLKLHCLIVTATQSDAASYKAELMGMHHFTDDRRKIDHVTGMIGINQTADEMGRSIMRLNWISLRDASYNTRKCVYTASCLELGNPAVKSIF